MSSNLRYRVKWVIKYDEFGSHEWCDLIFIKKDEALKFLKKKGDSARLITEEYLPRENGLYYAWDVIGENLYYDHYQKEFYF